MSEEIKKTTLHCQEGVSNKLYTIWIESKDGGYVVLAQWGRVGNSMQSGSKTPSPVPLEKATAIMEKVIKEKLAKGYKYYGEAAPAYTHVDGAKDTGVRVMLLTPGTEEDLEWLIKNNDWAAQQKLNGKRIAVIVKDHGKVSGVNRRGLECSIPSEIAKALNNCGSVEPFVLDGEMVSDVYYMFDVLKISEDDKTNLSLLKRHEILSSFCSLIKQPKMPSCLNLVPLVIGEKNKRTIVEELRKGNKEGVVFKKLDGLYVPGKIENIKKALAIKVKFYAELSAIVEKWNEKNSISLFAIDGTKKVHIGNVTVPEKYKSQIVVGGIVSVKYLYATDASILYQPNLNPDDNGEVMRDDIPVGDCVIGQLKYEGKD
ncbi:MAG: WGR domain-containing protein [Caldisericia bacterium]